ncbi:unnamed protein product [Chilo suppressalis]|uniref:EIF-4F 25 kDa subunit n=1 Tax=Chilo suppressalis TaxID=168631 RepID=A0ABN8LCB6_CHISP|nr:hypothetical protein evm_008108 [Chilo suppressalis]CAH2992389.1 unnamed protein product [Chilo suppressalis]
MGGKTSETAALPSPVKSVVVELIPPSLVDEKASETNSIEQIKHPLENTWTVWFYTNTSQKWNENLVNITSFDTVEDFWCLFHHMKLPSELQHGQEYSIFKGGVRPMWEDAANKKGGRLLIPVDRKNYEEVNKIWLDTILLMIGENFNDLNRIIRGVVVNIRPKTDRTKVGVWLADKNKKDENIRFGMKLKEFLGISWPLNFCAHNSNKAMYQV